MMGETEAVVSVKQDEKLATQAVFVGVSTLFINMISDIFVGMNYIELISGVVIFIFIVLSFIPRVIEMVRCFISEEEDAPNLTNSLTIISAVYLLADIFMDYYSIEHRIVAIIFSLFCVGFVLYVFAWKRYMHSN